MTPRQVAAAVQSPEPGARVEARTAPRVPASAVAGIKGIRLSPHGTEATLLNISASGILVECTSRLRLGTAVTTIFDGTFSPASVEGRVARSSVANVSKKGILQYHIGIAFLSPIAFDQAPAAEIPQPDAPPQAPSAAPVPPVIGNRW
jgi:PilZ domain